MQGFRAAGLRALPLLWLWLSRTAALHPGELFPSGRAWGDYLLQEGDDESSAAVKLASPLRFYEEQFSYLYVSTTPGAGLNKFLAAASQGSCSVDLTDPCLRRGGNGPHARLSLSTPGEGLALLLCCCLTRCFLPREGERELFAAV